MDDPNAYRFTHLRMGMILRDMYFRKTDLGAGDRMVEFDLPTTDGGRFATAQLLETGPALMIFGSATCPVTASAAPGLRELHRTYGEAVRMVMVNVREAHPGAGVGQPDDMATKEKHAREMKSLFSLPFEVAVDDIDGALHRALSPKPNSAYLVSKEGTILFRAHWANDTGAIEEALHAAVEGRRIPKPHARGLIRPMWPTARYVAPVLDRAGGGAWRDLWISAMPMAVLGTVARLFAAKPFSGQRSSAPDRIPSNDRSAE